jgi:hypothetical protein
MTVEIGTEAVQSLFWEYINLKWDFPQCRIRKQISNGDATAISVIKA